MYIFSIFREENLFLQKRVGEGTDAGSPTHSEDLPELMPPSVTNHWLSCSAKRRPRIHRSQPAPADMNGFLQHVTKNIHSSVTLTSPEPTGSESKPSDSSQWFIWSLEYFQQLNRNRSSCIRPACWRFCRTRNWADILQKPTTITYYPPRIFLFMYIQILSFI